MVIVIKFDYITFCIRLIMLTIITSIAISGTYAKYTSSSDTEVATATVASWSVLVNGTDISETEEELTFDIFDTVYDSDGVTVESDVKVPVASSSGGGSNSLDATIHAGGNDSSVTTEVIPIIAPGTSGSFTFKIVNYSDVKITYEIDFTEANLDNIPIEYSLDKVNYYNLADFETQLDNNVTSINMNSTKSINIYWRWLYSSDGSNSYGQTDETDTTLGTDTGYPDYEISAEITTTQID